MDKEEARRLKEELNESFSDEYINNAGLLLHRLAEEFYRENGLEGHVYFNDRIFEYCLIDILVDIARLKHFHDISRVNYIKFIAYTASWCLKRKPFQLIEGCDEKYLYVNETFALSLLLQAGGCLDEAAGYYEEDRDELLDEIGQIFYHLKYRNTNPQTLELFLIGMGAGKKILS
jgi:hypothetical protein